MRIPYLRPLLLIGVGTSLACATASTIPPAPDAGPAVRARTAAQARALAAGDVDAATAFYVADAYLLPPNAPMATGTEAIRQSWKETLALPNLKVALNTTDVRASAANDMALEVGTYRISFDSPDGPVSDDGKYSVVWKRVDENWMIVSDAWSSNHPVPEPPAGPAVVADASDMGVMAQSALKWGPLELPGFDPGLQLAVIHGDPMTEGDYTIRLKFPDGYKVPSHWHPNAEHLTVLKGTFMLGMGPKAGATAATAYQPGDFLYIPAKMPHFGSVKGETIIQLHGMGPFTVTLSQQS